MKLGAPLLLICLPEVIRKIAVHQAFVIIADEI